MIDKLSGPSRKRLEEFDEAAQSFGSEQESGYGGSVDVAREEYQDARTRLIRRIYNLEKKARRSP